MENNLELKLTELTGEIKGFKERAEAEVKSLGTVTTETKAALDKLQTQVDAIDLKMADRQVQESEHPDWKTAFKENESLARICRDGVGKAVIRLDGKAAKQLIERKTTITSDAVGRMTTGVLAIDRYSGLTAEARQRLTLRGVLSARPTTLGLIDYVKTNSISLRPTTSPQTEAQTKFEGAATFTSASERVQTLSVFIPASKQVLDDQSELLGYLETALPYYVNLEEEYQILAGSGTGVNLNGLNTVATAFSTTLRNASQYASKGYYTMDDIARAIQQIAVAKEVDPTFAVLHPTDWWNMRLQRDLYGRYILGDPQSPVEPLLWGLQVVPTTVQTAGTFTVGSGNPAATELRDRMEMQVDISTEDANNFTKNLITIRAEKRVALVTRRPGSFITGTFASSPA